MVVGVDPVGRGEDDKDGNGKASVDPVERWLDAAEGGRTLIEDRSVLRFDYMPDVILHRDSEQEDIAQALLPVLKQSRPSNLIIYGKPGTGKTLTVKSVLAKIEARVRTKFEFRVAYTNSKMETTLSNLMVAIGREIGLTSSKLPTSGLSISEIFARLLKAIERDSLNVVVVIDEIDHLAKNIPKSNNDVMYQLTRANERLVEGSLMVIGISNDLKFKERLDPRVVSSLGEEEIVFTDYSVRQIRAILGERVKAAFQPGAVQEAALNLCAAMAGRENGDARRAIDLLRVASETAERQQATSVSEAHIHEAAKKMEENKEELTIKSFPLHEKLLVMAVMKAPGAVTGSIYTSYKSLCRRVGEKELTQRRITQMLGDMDLLGIINGRLANQGTHGRTKKHTLTISSETVKRTFSKDEVLRDIM